MQILLVVNAAATAAIVAFMSTPLLPVVAVLAALLLLCAVLIPLEWYPSYLLIIFAFFPVSVLPGTSITSKFSPVLVLSVIWAARDWSSRGPNPARLPSILLASWLVISIVFSIDRFKSLGWSVNFTVLVLLVPWLCANRTAMARDLLRNTWVTLSGALGAYAIIEHYLERNPIGLLANNYLIDQSIWSVYRVTTTLGTPLMNGLFFAGGICLTWVRLFRSGLRPILLLWLMCSAGGLSFTFSRSALLTTGATIGIVTAVIIY